MAKGKIDLNIVNDSQFKEIYDKDKHLYYHRVWLKSEFTIESGTKFID